MDLRIAQRIIGILLMGFAATLTLPLGLSVYDADGLHPEWIDSILLIGLTGTVLALLATGRREEPRLREGFVVVASAWIVMSLVGALPFMLTMVESINLTDAVFEATSGLTTTGATVFSGLDDLPRSVLLYRQLLQWIGGMGVILLGVAILPLFGIGGMAIYKTESPGPVRDSRLLPRVVQTARSLWIVYLTLTVLCAGSYWGLGMSGFDAITHAFSTISTGGFSTHDANIAYFHSGAIELAATLFMLLSGLNFVLHFTAWVRGRPGVFLTNPETKLYLRLFWLVVIISTVGLVMTEYEMLLPAARHALFTTASILTSTGFRTVEFSLWPGMLPAMLIFLSMIGGCGGSTSGGMKCVRFYMIFKQLRWEVSKLIHPGTIPVVLISGRKVDNQIVRSVWGFFFVYSTVFAVIMLALMFTGLDEVSAFSAVAATLNNLGPGLGEVSSSFASLSEVGKWVSSFTMVLGRLEIFTILVLLMPEFWRA
jgi:trk/ktr system potassium uptake protein